MLCKVTYCAWLEDIILTSVVCEWKSLGKWWNIHTKGTFGFVLPPCFMLFSFPGSPNWLDFLLSISRMHDDVIFKTNDLYIYKSILKSPLCFNNPFETQQTELLVVTVSYSHLPGYIQISIIMTNHQNKNAQQISNI